MKRSSMEPSVRTAFTLLLLCFLGTTITQAAAGEHNWPYSNYDEFGTNHNPQNVVNKQNLNRLTVGWVLEIPRREDDLGYGVIAPPLIVEGVVYLATNSPSIMAVEAASGEIVWEYRPSLQETPSTPPHNHAINYYDGLLLYPAPDCTIRLVNATTGVETAVITDVCRNVPGNSGMYAPGGPAPVVDHVRGVVVWGPSVAGGTAAGRGFVAGFSLNGSMLWRLFITPPAGGDPSWGSKYVVERGGKFYEGAARGNVEPTSGDWGDLGLYLGSTRAGGGLSFGHISLDSEQGVVYLSTANPKPDWNATYRPGPNLYTNTIMALNVSTGDMLWFYQAIPHDFYDHDCAWNTVLHKPSNTVIKACKNGEVYALNASDGVLLWRFDPPSLKKTLQPSLTKRWHNDPSVQSFLQCPGAFGGVESDVALAYGKVYVAVMNLCTIHVPTPVEEHSPLVKGSVFNIAPLPVNTTIYAVSIKDGQVVWSRFINSAYRGWLTATGGMVIASTTSEGMFFLDAETGEIIRRLDLDGVLRTGAVVGSDGRGRFIILQLVEKQGGVGEAGHRQVLVALRLDEQPTPWTPIALLAAAAALVILLVGRVSVNNRKPSLRRQRLEPSEQGR